LDATKERNDHSALLAGFGENLGTRRAGVSEDSRNENPQESPARLREVVGIEKPAANQEPVNIESGVNPQYISTALASLTTSR